MATACSYHSYLIEQSITSFVWQQPEISRFETTTTDRVYTGGAVRLEMLFKTKFDEHARTTYSKFRGCYETEVRIEIQNIKINSTGRL